MITRIISNLVRLFRIDVVTVLAIKGFPVRKTAKLLKSIEKSVDYNKYHDEMRWSIYRYFHTHSKKYRDLCGWEVTNWADVPVTNRRVLSGAPESWFPDDLDTHNLYSSSTSGSSGTPFLFARDAFSHAMVWLTLKRFYSLAGVNLSSYQARFFGMSRTKESKRQARFKDALAGRFRFDVYDVSDGAIEGWIDDFSKHKYEYIYGYSNTLIAFASYMKQHNKVLKSYCPSLVSCIVTSEVCSDKDAALISKGFGVPVFNEYGSSELGIMGFKIDKNWMSNDDLLYVEVLDNEGNILPDGEVGLITCTSFYNKATPLIRYQTGDLAAIERQPDGRVIITSLQGSVNDMAITASGKKIPGISFYFVAQQLLDSTGKITEFVVIQKEINRFVFRYAAEEPLTDAEFDILKQGFADYVAPEVEVIADHVRFIERKENGKFKHFISELPI